MRRTTRTAAGALALAVAFGVGSPVASAAGGAAVAKPDHAKVAKDHKKLKGSQELRQVLRDLARTDARLLKAVRESRTARIGDHVAAVLANVAADRAALADLGAGVQAADSTHDLRAVRRALKDVRPQTYTKVVNDLRHAVRLAVEIAAAGAALEGDAAAPVDELAAAQTALDAAIAKALLVTASSDRDELRAVKADLRAAREALAAVRSYLEGLATEDEVTEDEVTED